MIDYKAEKTLKNVLKIVLIETVWKEMQDPRQIQDTPAQKR